MQLNDNQYQKIADCFPRQRGNVSMDNLSVLNAFLYVTENGCKWRRLPSHFGNWHTIYTRVSRWTKAGVLALLEFSQSFNSYRYLLSRYFIQHRFIPVVPPKKNRLAPWKYDKELYKRRNEVDRLFRRLKGFRRIFTRY